MIKCGPKPCSIERVAVADRKGRRQSNLFVTADIKDKSGIGSCSGACVAYLSEGAIDPVKVSAI